jgi:hypothetical protein
MGLRRDVNPGPVWNLLNRDNPGLLTLLGRAAPGADFFEFKERRATDTGCLLARSNAEIGKIGPGPKGCGENRAILRCRPSLGIA